MADPTTLSSANIHMATEALAEQVLVASMPRVGVLQGQSHLDLSGVGELRSMTRKVSVRLDHGAAAAGTEATDPSPSPTVELDNDTPITGTYTTGVKEIALISEEHLRVELGMSDAEASAILSGRRVIGDVEARTLLSGYAWQLIPMGLRKIEADGLAKFAGISGSVGSAAERMNLDVAVQAIFAHRRQKPRMNPRAAKFLLGNTQIENLTKDMLVVDGGKGSALFNSQAQYSAAGVPSETFEEDGAVGAILGRDIHEIDETLVPTSGGADIGCYGTFGVRGVSATDPRLMGKCGGLELAFMTPLQLRADLDTSKAVIELTLLARYIWIETSDPDLVRTLAMS